MESTRHMCFLPLIDGEEQPASPEQIDLLTIAKAHGVVGSLASRLSFRLQELTRKAAYHHFLRLAVESAEPDAGTDGMVQVLEREYALLSEELAACNDSLKLAELRAKERSSAIAPILVLAGNAAIKRENQITLLREKIREARKSGLKQSDRYKSYRAAGLTTEQIAALGDAGLTVNDVESWDWQIKVLEGEVQRLNAFLTDPLHRMSQLQGLELTEADDYPVGRMQPKAFTEQSIPVVNQSEIRPIIVVAGDSSGTSDAQASNLKRAPSGRS